MEKIKSGFEQMEISIYHDLVSRIEDSQLRAEIIQEIDRLNNRIKSLELSMQFSISTMVDTLEHKNKPKYC